MPSSPKPLDFLQTHEGHEWAKNHRAFRKLAEHVGCQPLDVAQAFESLADPDRASTASRHAFAQSAATYSEAAELVRKASLLLLSLPENEHAAMQLTGPSLTSSLTDAAERLEALCNARRSAAQAHGPANRKNHGAHLVARGVANLFDAMGIPVTFGKYAGAPRGRFCQAVQAGIEAFEIAVDVTPAHWVATVNKKQPKKYVEASRKPADWEAPAKAIWDERKAMEKSELS